MGVNKEHKGKINLILGPMFSGKSSMLISRYNKYLLGGKKCIMVKYKGDIRYDTQKIVTHDGYKVNAVVCENLYEIEHLVNDCEVICIDEVQFYKDAHIFSDKWANEGRIIEACGLNGTFERKPFDIISRLLPLVRHITYLTAVCRETGKDAIYSMRTTSETKEEVIGGSEKYSAVDRYTYSKNVDTVEQNLSEFLEIYTSLHGNILVDKEIKEKIIHNFKSQERVAYL